MKKILLSILFVIVAFMFTITNVNARGFATSGDTITQKGKFDSIRFAFGNNITNKADINGLSFVAGEKVTLEGKAPYGFYGGNTVDVSENVENDAFIAGKYITLTNKATIGRDAFLAASSIKVNTTIGRDLRAGASTVDLKGAIINGDAYIAADKIIFDDNTRIAGKLSYAKDTKIIGLNKDNIKNIKVTKAKNADKEKKSTTTIVLEKLEAVFFSIIRAFIVMIVLLWLLPRLDEKLKKEETKASSIAIKSLIGLGLLLAVPIIALIAVFINILTPLALITFAIYATALYIGSIFVYYLIGMTIDKKLTKKENRYISLLLGIVIVKLVALIPILGGLISFVIFLYGIGLVFNYIFSIRKDA